MLFGVDAGGSRTRVAVRMSGEVVEQIFEIGPMVPASIGERAARDGALRLFRRLADFASGGATTGCIGSAAATPANLHATSLWLARLAAEAGLRGRFVLAEDATVALLGPPLNGVGILCVVGTGSITIGRGVDGRRVQCGGYEYVVSDEGSGYDLGLTGLRAASRAYDGRGPATALVGAAEDHFGLSIPALGDWLAALPSPKGRVAAFAPRVCEIAAAGDAVALAAVEACAREIVTAVVTVSDALSRSRLPIAFVGGLINGCALFAERVLRSVREAVDGADVHLLDDPVRCALALAERLDESAALMGDFPYAVASVP